MSVLKEGPHCTSSVRPVVPRRPGMELVGGADESEDAADMLTCTLERFEALMRQAHPDWQEFSDWTAERRAAGVAFDGRQSGAAG